MLFALLTRTRSTPPANKVTTSFVRRTKLAPIAVVVGPLGVRNEGMLSKRQLVARRAEQVEVGVRLGDVVPSALRPDHSVAAGTPCLGRAMLAGGGREILEASARPEMHADQTVG